MGESGKGENTTNNVSPKCPSTWIFFFQINTGVKSDCPKLLPKGVQKGDWELLLNEIFMLLLK